MLITHHYEPKIQVNYDDISIIRKAKGGVEVVLKKHRKIIFLKKPENHRPIWKKYMVRSMITFLIWRFEHSKVDNNIFNSVVNFVDGTQYATNTEWIKARHYFKQDTSSETINKLKTLRNEIKKDFVKDKNQFQLEYIYS
jgi:cell shape-determining protein MreC